MTYSLKENAVISLKQIFFFFFLEMQAVVNRICLEIFHVNSNI